MIDHRAVGEGVRSRGELKPTDFKVTFSESAALFISGVAWVSHLIFQCLTFLICIMEIRKPSSQNFLRTK